MARSLVAFDTDRIKEYVFATGRLVEIRGASALLDRLNRQDMVRLVGGEAIFAHGGSGLFSLPTDKAEAAIRAVQGRYRGATAAATVSGASIELPADFDEDSDLRPHWRRLSIKLRVAKDRNPGYASVVAHPLLRPCDSCGTYYAAKAYPEPGGHSSMLCLACLVKRQEDRQIKDEIGEFTGGTSRPATNRLWHQLMAELLEADYPLGKLVRPEDFDTLGEQSRPRGYFGLIYADGDDMGRRLEEISSLDGMRRFARAVDESVYGAMKQAILSRLRPEPDAWSLPFDVLLLGGDDLIMATTAQAAVETALCVLDNFPELTERSYRERVSLSVAVILAHVKFPIGSLVELAESALKFAKKERVRRGLKDGLLNFLVVSSANHLDFGEYYRATLEVEEGDTVLYRTMRPYASSDMHRLIEAKRSLAEAPRGRLEQLRAALFKSRDQAELEGLVAWSRWRDQDQRRKVWELVSDFSENAGQPVRFPWAYRGGAYRSPLLDLVELFDFIP